MVVEDKKKQQNSNQQFKIQSTITYMKKQNKFLLGHYESYTRPISLAKGSDDLSNG